MMQDLQSDRELARQAAQGDEKAWRRIYEETCDRLFALLCYQVRDRDTARDLLQETYIQAFRHLHHYRGEAPLGAWLRTIAMRKSLDWKRHVLRRLMRTAPLTETIAAPEVDSSEVRFDSERRALDEAMAHLSAPQRAALLLREWEGWSFREIAGALHCKESTARVHHTRARKRLALALKGGPAPVAAEGLEGQPT
jgi:RNA polymerase sigma-70 factor (ECF subfamily)